MGIERASLENLETGELFEVSLNPEEYSVTSGNEYASIGGPGPDRPPVQFIRGRSRMLRVELLFDSFEAGRDVREITRGLTALGASSPKTKAPPRLLFSWGRFQFRCVLESVTERFTLFHSDGSPGRAYLDVELREYGPLAPGPQGSGGALPGRTRSVSPGETLAQIAHEVLGSPTRWRDLADLNSLQNPRKIAGLLLKLPAQT